MTENLLLLAALVAMAIPASCRRDQAIPPEGKSQVAPGQAGGSGGLRTRRYTDWKDCGADDGTHPEVPKCLCDAMSRCTAFSGETTFGLGSDRYRICGARDGLCMIATFHEVEGGGQGHLCLVPPGKSVCTAGRVSLQSAAAGCTAVFDCNVLLGNCPGDTVACPP